MYLGHRRVTRQRHREVELGEGVLDDGLHPFGARERQTVAVGEPVCSAPTLALARTA